VWLQDLPPRAAPIPHDPKVVDDFPSIMQTVLRAVNVRPALANMLANDVSHIKKHCFRITDHVP